MQVPQTLSATVHQGLRLENQCNFNQQSLSCPNTSILQRAHVICGLHEPTDEEIAGMSDDEKDDELCAEIKAKVKIEDLMPPKDQKAKEEAE